MTPIASSADAGRHPLPDILRCIASSVRTRPSLERVRTWKRGSCADGPRNGRPAPLGSPTRMRSVPSGVRWRKHGREGHQGAPRGREADRHHEQEMNQRPLSPFMAAS